VETGSIHGTNAGPCLTTCGLGRRFSAGDKERIMNNTTLIIIIILVLLVLGGGWYGRGRWY
jgi:hypothetical protein